MYIYARMKTFTCIYIKQANLYGHVHTHASFLHHQQQTLTKFHSFYHLTSAFIMLHAHLTPTRTHTDTYTYAQRPLHPLTQYRSEGVKRRG